MSRRVGSLQSLALCLAVLLAAAGCSNMPTAPQASMDPGTTMNVTEGSQSEVLGLNLGGTSSTTTKSATVGLLGGVMAVGDFTLVIPPGALTRTATVTVSQPDLAHPVVNLSISPATANGFLLPVLLTSKVNRVDPALLSITCISYYNPTTGQWERVAGTSVSALNLTVTAPLWHFSTYRVSTGGKAGW